jgi:hypothetical protein
LRTTIRALRAVSQAVNGCAAHFSCRLLTLRAETGSLYTLITTSSLFHFGGIKDGNRFKEGEKGYLESNLRS